MIIKTQITLHYRLNMCNTSLIYSMYCQISCGFYCTLASSSSKISAPLLQAMTLGFTEMFG